VQLERRPSDRKEAEDGGRVSARAVRG
jgi:hypothetical protein